MLVVKIAPGEQIERALKRYRNKVRKTQQLKRIRSYQEYTKKSTAKREELKKAIYKNEYMRNQEN
ncbi:small subunit ribosomal protein S21 [Robiginitalea myxolifaciens]|uniref:Small ribosomal subunit protein bS21 n=1 Tax=Robiginitalea myxolifaciens TaxID=400055 RepID=A0A1I6FWV2_9FLAO|nr:30S ribosomal protein S21 [Robiginitalea myxolifaciens]SFR34277.1 small subunit ribosomal protein S21 [Robiginitalea myxolifaciens]